MKTNCWEFKNCGRHPEGPKVQELGVCPAAKVPSFFDGKNSGKSAGRYCWKVAGTLCGGKVQGTSAEKIQNCQVCQFYLSVKQDEGKDFIE